ncbi:lytic transglycosylase domain-containing protein [Neisseria sp. MVDL19-042950]|uniref:lytic transglycosylase domain-containing protein n=1 Tax=Neisseria sp. MVDL19-042950 TaxID=3061169 RepID=UPI0026602C15|nr:lytic transglycosylase domain-containing protein [Neisseria sp. MVDL19-042950]MDO1509550.1 lytic transglycosylase domain-containing protein [Neisseria sp. MVDL19-042950]
MEKRKQTNVYISFSVMPSEVFQTAFFTLHKGVSKLKRNKTIFVLATAFCSAICTAAPYPQYQHLVEKHAAAQGLDANLVWAVMARESGGNRYALSNKNARGLMQVIPPTAARMGVNPKHLYIPEYNILAGTRYLKFLSKRYNGNIDLMLAGYNAGEEAVDKYKGIPPYRETQNYVRLVRNRYAQLSGNPAHAARIRTAFVKAAHRTQPVAKVGRIKPAEMVYTQAPKQYASWDVFREF